MKFTSCSVKLFTFVLYFLRGYSGNHSCQFFSVKTTGHIYIFYSLTGLKFLKSNKHLNGPCTKYNSFTVVHVV